MVSLEEGGNTTTYQYNVEGIRTAQSASGSSTHYLVDHNRDYAQVLSEVENGAAIVRYTYGDDLISQQRNAATFFYHYDGLGSTRGLSDASGSLTDSYHYEAFGEVLNQTGSTENSYLFTGEQFDAGLNQYYLRARYYNQANGRFTQMDTFQGFNADPVTLHKYLYANSDPISFVDPSGNIGLGSIGTALRINGILTTTAATGGRSLISRALTGSGREAFGIIGEEVIGFAKEALLNVLVQELAGPGFKNAGAKGTCLLYTSPSPRDLSTSRMPSSA